MFEVKVKTLDGRTHEFSVPDNATVLEFKEIIRAEMEIAVDRQRLLYQGRVLQDENVLSAYDVAGNVMHLVTRMPPQPARPTNDANIEREENSDINRDQIRNILSDVFTNIGDLNNPMGSVSVNNEGSRMDITVNIPTQNRLSLSRLRQNYVMRLLDQARNVIRHMEDPSIAAPRLDRERLRQTDPYDIGPNDERLTEVTSQPLPISNLADMISNTRSLWRDAEPQLELWESVLRRENTTRSENDMQRMHDSASRYVHLFSHALHILSDYLVEFQQGTAIRQTVATAATMVTNNQTAATANDAATSVSIDEGNVPLTGACGESGMAHSETNTATTTTATNATATDTAASSDIGDRSRYLYVFSEMPAQLVQVRLDVDSNIPNLRTAANVQSTTAQSQANVQTPSATETARQTESPTEPAANTAHVSNESVDPRPRSRRRFQANGNTMENLFRSTIHDTLMGPNIRPQMPSGSRTIRSTPQFMENVDPYVRCQSRHFQHPSNLRSGAVISTISGIRLRESSRTRPRNAETTPTSTANSTTTPMTNVRSQSNDTDPMRSLISGFMNSIFPSSGEVSRSTTTEHPAHPTAATQPTNNPVNFPSEIQRLLQTLTSSGGNNLNQPLSQVFPDLLSNQDIDPDNFVTNQIIQIVVSRLTLIDFVGIVRGQYTPLNQLRVPLQEVLLQHQREAGSRDSLIDHVVADLEFFNRAYVQMFERLRSGEPMENLSEEARSSFNIRVDIFRTINNLNRHHFQSMIDMILRSPTNQGFGQLLMTRLTSHHDESLALIDIICNNNDELRRFLIKSFMDSLLSSMNTEGNGPSMNSLGLDLVLGGVDSGLFRRPEQLALLKEHAMNHFVVYFSENGNDAASVSLDGSVGNMDSIDDMVTNLSEEILSGASLAELSKHQALPTCTLVGGLASECMDTCVQGEVPVPGWRQGVLPAEWLQVISRDSGAPTAAAAMATTETPYSDAYVAGMPPKRRKVILSQRQRAVQPALEMMNECIDQAILASGAVAMENAPNTRSSFPASISDAFQEMVADRVGNRINTEVGNFPVDRFPSADENFARKKRAEDDGKNKNN